MSPNLARPDYPEIAASLPQPDAYANYWLGDKAGCGPCILSSAVVKGTWMASLGDYGSVLFDGPTIKRYPSPSDALKALRSAMMVARLSR